MFNRLDHDSANHLFTFFRSMELAKIASVSRQFNQAWEQRAVLGQIAFAQLEERCALYKNGDACFMTINTTYIFSTAMTKDKSLSMHPVIKKLKKCTENGDIIYLFSPNGVEFHCMELNSYRGIGGVYGATFHAHDDDQHHKMCRLYVDSSLAMLYKGKGGVSYGEKIADHNVLATYALAQSTEKKKTLMKLLTNESHFIPLQYREEPFFLFKILGDSQEYIFVSRSIREKKFKVLTGSPHTMYEVTVEGKTSRFDGVKIFTLDKASGYTKLFASSDKEFKSSIVLTDGREIIIETLNAADYTFLGIALATSPNPRFTLLDAVDNNLQSSLKL